MKLYSELQLGYREFQMWQRYPLPINSIFLAKHWKRPAQIPITIQSEDWDPAIVGITRAALQFYFYFYPVWFAFDANGVRRRFPLIGLQMFMMSTTHGNDIV